MVTAGKFGGLQEESARQPLKLLFPKNFLGLPNKRDAKEECGRKWIQDSYRSSFKNLSLPLTIYVTLIRPHSSIYFRIKMSKYVKLLVQCLA